MAHNNSKRYGLVPVEFVLVTPLLLLIFACIWSIGTAGLGRMNAAITARAQVVQRSGAAEERPAPLPTPFENITNRGHSTGLVTVNASKSLSLRPSRMFGSMNQAQSRAVALTDTWDYHRVAFESDPLQPDIGRSMQLLASASAYSTLKPLENLETVFREFKTIGRAVDGVGRIATMAQRLIKSAERLQKAVIKLTKVAKQIGDIGKKLGDLATVLDPSKWDDPGELLNSVGEALGGLGSAVSGLFGGGGGESPLSGVLSAFAEVVNAFNDLKELQEDITGLPGKMKDLLARANLNLQDKIKDKFEDEVKKQLTGNLNLSMLPKLHEPENLENLFKAPEQLGRLKDLIEKLSNTNP